MYQYNTAPTDTDNIYTWNYLFLLSMDQLDTSCRDQAPSAVLRSGRPLPPALVTALHYSYCTALHCSYYAALAALPCTPQLESGWYPGHSR